MASLPVGDTHIGPAKVIAFEQQRLSADARKSIGAAITQVECRRVSPAAKLLVGASGRSNLCGVHSDRLNTCTMDKEVEIANRQGTSLGSENDRALELCERGNQPPGCLGDRARQSFRLRFTEKNRNNGRGIDHHRSLALEGAILGVAEDRIRGSLIDGG